MPKITEKNRWRGGKSYHKYCYTVQDIAAITERAIGTIRNDMSKKKLIMDDLRSVAEYIGGKK
jgi:cell division protein FtsB